MPRPTSSLLGFDLPTSSQNFKRSAGARDFFLRRLAESVRANRQRHIQFTAAQNLYAMALRPDDPVRRQYFRSHGLARRKGIQSLDVHHRKRLRKRAGKAALRKAPVKRHLASF